MKDKRENPREAANKFITRPPDRGAHMINTGTAITGSTPFPKGHGNLKTGKVYKTSAEVIRKFIESAKRDDLDPLRSQTRLIRMVANMVDVACSNSKNNVAAFEALMARAYGRPRPSDEETNAIAKGGITIVYGSNPQRDPDIRPAEDLPAPEPRFLPAEFREDE